MEHPLIPNLENLTIDELSSRINELSKKLNIAYRSGNNYLCSQISMSIESYQNTYNQKLQQQYAKDSSAGTNFENKIQIQ